MYMDHSQNTTLYVVPPGYHDIAIESRDEELCM